MKATLIYIGGEYKMKKIIISLLLLTMGFGALGTGCSSIKNDESSSSSVSSTSSESSDNSSSENLSSNEELDSDFIWEEGKYITDLSEEGKKKKDIVIPENCQNILISTIGSASGTGFNNNDNIESISFESEYVTYLPDFFLQLDTNLKSVEIPKKLNIIPNNFIACCSLVTSIDIPSTVTKIGHHAFAETGIEEMKIPEGVTTVDELVFRFTPIKKLYLPESLNEINSRFLTDIDNLDENGKTLYNLEVYVKEGSYADQHFSDYANSTTVKKYY